MGGCFTSCFGGDKPQWEAGSSKNSPGNDQASTVASPFQEEAGVDTYSFEGDDPKVQPSANSSTLPAPGSAAARLASASAKARAGNPAESHRRSLKLTEDIVSAWSNYGLERAKTANRSTDDYRLQEDSGANWLSPKSSIHLAAEVEQMDPGQTLGIMNQFTCNAPHLRGALASEAPALYIIGQVSLGELTHWCRTNPGCVLFVQGLPGFNVVEMLENGQLQEATREQVMEVCQKHRCLLFNLIAADCIKVGFDELQALFETCIPSGHSRDVLSAYRASSFGSFAASMSRGKIKVIDGAATDGLIRSVDVSIGETVERVRAFEVKMYVDAMELCEEDLEKSEIFQEVLDAVIADDSDTPEVYLTRRVEGFGVPEAFTRLRERCASEITTAAYSPGGVLAGCQTPVYDDWTIHQALRILAGTVPLDKDNEANIKDHLAFITACMKFVYGTAPVLAPYAAQLFSSIKKRQHIVLHDVGSDTGPDDFPACAMLMAMAKHNASGQVRLLAVGGEVKYRAMRTRLLENLIPEVPHVELACAPFLPDLSIPSPFVPTALVTTCEGLDQPPAS